MVFSGNRSILYVSNQVLPDSSELGFPRWTARSLVEQHQDPESHTDLKPISLQGIFVLLFHCVAHREVRKHLRAVLAGKKLQLDDSATTRATLLTVGGAGDPSSPGLGAGGRVGSCEDQTHYVPWALYLSTHHGAEASWKRLCPTPAPLARASEDGDQGSYNQKQFPQGVRCFHSVRARKCSHFAARLQFAALSIPPLCSHGGRRGDNADLWLLLTNSLFPFPTSAPSTATTPTAKGQTCSAPPWASPQPLWTVPPGQASVLTVSLGVNNAAPCLECCCFRCLFCPHLLGEGGLSVTAVDSAQKGWA